ncbi:MAG: tetratricopeptide repeat protein [Gammaproteobacteria bacterium]|nr:tetratricopeptide repeat protein [Pseudomonadales bacterium]MCP5347603.1 tetratricopeptide repeat protein [Pseudomonadales bacterium]
MSRFIQKLRRLPLGLLFLAWPLLGYSENAGNTDNTQNTQYARMTEGSTVSSEADMVLVPMDSRTNLSVYETLVFDLPIPMQEEFQGYTGLEEIDVFSLQPEDGLVEEQLLAIQHLESNISEIEQTGGPWDLNLSENLVAMAELYEQQGAYDEAIDAYARAMHISRVNLGLDSLDHIPMAEHLVEAYLAKGDLASADQYQEYLYYTQSRVFGFEDPRIVPALDRLASWKLKIFNAGFGEPLALQLVSALRLYQAASNIVSHNFGNRDERYAKYLRDTAGTAFLVSRYKGLIDETPITEFRTIQERYPDGYRDYNVAFIEGYEEGLEALQLIADSFAEEQHDSKEYAKALVHLADWYLLFDRQRSAESSYAEAYQVLSGQENSAELIGELFGTVRPLPAFSDEIETIFIKSTMEGREQVARASGFVDVRFDVTQYGTATNLEVLTEENEINERVISNLRRKVRATTFRPIVKDGEPVRSEGNQFRYRFVY